MWFLIFSYFCGETIGRHVWLGFSGKLSKYYPTGVPFAATCCTNVEITSTITRDDDWKGQSSYDNDIDLSGTYTYSAVHGHNCKKIA